MTSSEGASEGHRTSQRWFSARQVAFPWIVLVTLAVLAWLVTIQQARGMGIGPGTMGMSLPLFVGMWVATMIAMMFPSVAPVAVLWARSIAKRTAGAERALRIGSFAAGYLYHYLSGYRTRSTAHVSAIEPLDCLNL